MRCRCLEAQFFVPTINHVHDLALEAFIRRVENPRLVVDPPPYRRSNVFRGPEHLSIDFDGIRD